MGENLILGSLLAVLLLSGWSLAAFARKRRRSSASAGLLLILAGNMLMMTFLVSILALSGEIYYRFIYDSTDSFMYTKVCRHWFLRHWRENQDGLRDDVDCSTPRNPAKPRITFAGDSFTAGHGISDVENRFVNRVRRAHPQWEVHMLAVVGADTGYELSMLKSSLDAGYQIDRVVLVYCLNDIADLMPDRKEASDRIAADLAQSGWLRRSSYLVNTLYHRFKILRDPAMTNYFGYVLQAYRGPVWERQKDRLKEYRDQVESHGGRLKVVTFPFLHALGPRYEYQFVHDELGQFWRDLKVPHLDLLPVYREFPARKLTVNQFDAHPNEYAHALAAQAMDRFILEDLNKPR